MGSELELVTAACSDSYHLAWVETVMGQTPIRPRVGLAQAPHPPLQGVLPLHTEKFRFNQGGICDFDL